MDSFTFLHAADIHLDSPLKGLAGEEGAAAERVRSATRRALERLVGVAIEKRVDFVVIAGDLYDGDWRDFGTGLFFVGQMGRLNEAGIPAFVLYGNHDAESRITKRLPLPENTRAFGAREAETFTLKKPAVALHGWSFRERAVTDNLVPGYPESVPGAFNIGVLHTALAGGYDGHDNYAPCSLDDLVNKGYDYWALGHVHGARVLHEHPHVVFPGNLQGRHIRETGAKGASLVAVREGRVEEVAAAPCDVVRWALLETPVGGADSLGQVHERMRDAIAGAVSEAEGRLLACRIVLKGRTAVHARLAAGEDQLLAEARAAALGLGDEAAWVESVVDETRPAAAGRDPVMDELAELLAGAPDDEELLKAVKDDIGELVGRLPAEARGDVEDEALRLAIDADYSGLVRRVTPHLEARLAAHLEDPEG